jgi:hypothetical protein
VILRVLGGVRRRLLGGPPPGDYRAYLFEERVAYLDGRRPKRVLEIGPKDGQDTHRLLQLDPERLMLLDLPRLEASNRVWLDRIGSSRIAYVSANHVSMNITHLPSAKAIESWLAMVGLECIVRASCHRRVSRDLALARAAYLATRPVAPGAAFYYALAEGEGYEIGKSL